MTWRALYVSPCNPVNDAAACAAVLTHSNGADIANPAVDNIPLLVDVAATTCTQDAACTTSAADCRFTVAYKVAPSENTLSHNP